jgi:pimeloyl-ACP methyl ester carboxylesterase
VQLEVPDPASGRTVALVLGALDLQWVIAQVIGDPRALATLPAAAREMSAGDFRRIGPLALQLRRQAGVGSAMKHMMDLASDASAGRHARIEREAPGAVLGDAMNFPDRHLRAAWQARPLPDAFRQPVTTAVPALLLAGDLDARTPVENAHEIAAALPNAHVVVVENAAHQFDLFGPPPLRRLLARFVRGGGDLPTRVTLPPLRFESLPPARP